MDKEKENSKEINEVKEEVKFLIKTKLKEKDFKKFLYLATYFRKKITLPLMYTLSLIGSLGITYLDASSQEEFSIITAFVLSIVIFVLAIVMMNFKIARANKMRIKTDKIGTFDYECKLCFYDEYITFEMEETKAYSQIKYEQFFEVIESKDFYMFFVTSNQASIISKKDIDEKDLDKFSEFIKSKFKNNYKLMKL